MKGRRASGALLRSNWRLAVGIRAESSARMVDRQFAAIRLVSPAIWRRRDAFSGAVSGLSGATPGPWVANRRMGGPGKVHAIQFVVCEIQTFVTQMSSFCHDKTVRCKRSALFGPMPCQRLYFDPMTNVTLAWTGLACLILILSRTPAAILAVPGPVMCIVHVGAGVSPASETCCHDPARANRARGKWQTPSVARGELVSCRFWRFP